MENSFNSTSFGEDCSQTKRRRFESESDFQLMSCSDDGVIDCQNIDLPLLQQLCGRMPTQQEIEAELIRVGMRVNKVTAFTPRPFFNMARLSPATQAALCSVNKQPVSTATFCGVNLAALAHLSPTPIQEQKMWSYSTSSKRGYEGDSDSDDQDFMPHTPTLGNDSEAMAIPVDYFSIDFSGTGDVSPFTQVEEVVAPVMPNRRFAKPKSRIQQQRPVAPVQQPVFNPFAQLQMPQQPAGSPWSGGHRRMRSCGIEANLSLNGFGVENSFFQTRGDLDMDCS